MTLFLTVPCCFKVCFHGNVDKFNLKCSVFLQLLDLTSFSFCFGMNSPAYSAILKGLGLINACRSTTGQHLIPNPFKCRPCVNKSIGPLPALISLHLTSLTVILLLWDFMSLWKKTNIAGLPPQWWSRRRPHGGNFSPNSLLRAVHPLLCRHCKHPGWLRKVLVLNLSGSWSPTEHWRAHVATLEQFRPGQTPYRISVCWKPMHRVPDTYTGSYRAFATVTKFASSSNPFLMWAKPNICHNNQTQHWWDAKLHSLQTFIPTRTQATERSHDILPCCACFKPFTQMLIHSCQNLKTFSSNEGVTRRLWALQWFRLVNVNS